MTEVDFPKRAFQAVVCLYSLIHVPLAAQRPVLRRIHGWLVPGGWLVVLTGHEAYEGVEANWLKSGVPMYWSHADAATYRVWLQEDGFQVETQEFVPEGGGGHELFCAKTRRVSRRPKAVRSPHNLSGNSGSGPIPPNSGFHAQSTTGGCRTGSGTDVLSWPGH